MYKNGFSLVEVLLAVIFVGLAIVGLLAASASFTQVNAVGTDLSTAEFLVEQIKELTATLPVVEPNDTGNFGPEEATLAEYDDLDDFDGANFSPPINARREVLSNFPAFTQEVTVARVERTNFEQVTSDSSSPFVRVTVKVLLNSKEISSTSWVRARL
ncbi:MAG: hypothetical protein ACYTEQ_11225 [Planctomycetota bacterium]